MNILKSVINKLKAKFIAKQIQIEELGEELTLLREGKTDFDFIGITANGYDCLFFVTNNQNFNLEFRAFDAVQIPYLEKFKEFVAENSFQFDIEIVDKTPYLSINTNSTIPETVDLAKRIQVEIFGNTGNTKYTVVP